MVEKIAGEHHLTYLTRCITSASLQEMYDKLPQPALDGIAKRDQVKP